MLKIRACNALAITVFAAELAKEIAGIQYDGVLAKGVALQALHTSSRSFPSKLIDFQPLQLWLYRPQPFAADWLSRRHSTNGTAFSAPEPSRQVRIAATCFAIILLVVLIGLLISGWGRKSQIEDLTAAPSTRVSLWESNRGKAIIAIISLSLSVAVPVTSYSMWTYFFMELSSSLGEDLTWVELAPSVQYLVFAITAPVFDILANRVGIRANIWVGTFSTIGAYVLLAYATSLLHVYLAAVLHGITFGACFAACTTACIQLVPDDRQGTVAAIIGSAGFILTAIVVYPVDGLIQTKGVRPAYWLLGSISGILMFIAACALPSGAQVFHEREEGEEDVKTSEVICTHKFSCMFFIYLLGASHVFSMDLQFMPLLSSTIGDQVSERFLDTTFAVGSFALILGNLVWGEFCCTHRAVVVYIYALLLATVIGFVWASFSSSVLVNVVAASLDSACAGGVWTCIPLIAEQLFNEHAATAFAWANCSTVIAMTIGGMGQAYIVEATNWTWGIYVLALYPLLAAMLCVYITQRGMDIKQVSHKRDLVAKEVEGSEKGQDKLNAEQGNLADEVSRAEQVKQKGEEA